MAMEGWAVPRAFSRAEAESTPLVPSEIRAMAMRGWAAPRAFSRAEAESTPLVPSGIEGEGAEGTARKLPSLHERRGSPTATRRQAANAYGARRRSDEGGRN